MQRHENQVYKRTSSAVLRLSAFFSKTRTGTAPMTTEKPTKNVTVRLPAQTVEAFRALAAAAGEPPASLLREALTTAAQVPPSRWKRAMAALEALRE